MFTANSFRFVVFGLLLFRGATATGAEISVKTGSQGGVINKRVMSMKELKFRSVVRQQTDFSCGAAALATILKFFYGDSNVTENEIIEWLLKNGDVAKIRERGFSLLDLKQYAEQSGYLADGYRVKPAQLGKLKIPTIVLLSINDYAHFVVLKGVGEGKAYIADPSLGNKKIPLDEFCAAWNGIVFAVQGKGMASGYDPFSGPLSVNKGEVGRLSDLMMRNLFITSREFVR